MTRPIFKVGDHMIVIQTERKDPYPSLIGKEIEIIYVWPPDQQPLTRLDGPLGWYYKTIISGSRMGAYSFHELELIKLCKPLK